MQRIIKAILFSGLLAMLLPIAVLSQEPSKKATSERAKLQITQCALKVSGMTCGGCAGMVEKGLLKVDGVKTAKVDFKTGTMQVVYDSEKTTLEKIATAFNEANPGFRAEQSKPSAK
jgi:copper chaperone CopZ